MKLQLRQRQATASATCRSPQIFMEAVMPGTSWLEGDGVVEALVLRWDEPPTHGRVVGYQVEAAIGDGRLFETIIPNTV